jgi:hypothetical protein
MRDLIDVMANAGRTKGQREAAGAALEEVLKHFPYEPMLECSTCGGEIPDEVVASMLESGYEPESDGWACSTCSYLHFK